MSKRILIIGTSGSGKTTLAKRVATLLETTHVDLDDLYWLPGWIPRDESEFVSKVEEVFAKDAWIVSGNGLRKTGHVWGKADLIVWLDFPLWVLLWRGFKRSVRRIWNREECCNGNRETVRLFLSKYSIVCWILFSFRRRKKEYVQLFNERENVLRLRNASEVELFYKNLSTQE